MASDPDPEQMAQEPRLYRGGELEHAVATGHGLERLTADVPWTENRERLVVWVDVALQLVDDEHGEPPVGMVAGERVGQHPGVREVVLRDDRADVHGAATLAAPPGRATAGGGAPDAGLDAAGPAAGARCAATLGDMIDRDSGRPAALVASG